MLLKNLLVATLDVIDLLKHKFYGQRRGLCARSEVGRRALDVGWRVQSILQFFKLVTREGERLLAVAICIRIIRY